MKREELKVKKYKLDLSTYQIEVDEPKLDPETKAVVGVVKKNVDYPLRSNLSTWLRMGGMFKTAVDVAEAVTLAKAIRDEKPDYIILDEKEKEILTSVLDRLIELTADGKINPPVGGILHEEMICRVANMEEIIGE